MEKQANKRPHHQNDNKMNKKPRSECNYAENCYRKNPEHFKDYAHPHLEKILLDHKGIGPFAIPANLQFQKDILEQQLSIIMHSNILTRDSEDAVQLTKDTDKTGKNDKESDSSSTKTDRIFKTRDSSPTKSTKSHDTSPSKCSENKGSQRPDSLNIKGDAEKASSDGESNDRCSLQGTSKQTKPNTTAPGLTKNTNQASSQQTSNNEKKNIEDFFAVVAPKGQMAQKHANAAPYFIFYTTITDSPQTHHQPLSITFQELLDPSLGRLQCSLQINFMVDLGWLLAHYYFAGYNDKPLTILYGEDSDDLRTIGTKKANISAHMVPMKNAFGKHHTKMSILVYEDGSLRVVVSTANLYLDDWENRTQGLWLSPKCPKLLDPSDPQKGESPTGFKRSLINYLSAYSMACLSQYIEHVKQADFTDINVFLVCSVPGGHTDYQWGLGRMGSLLSKHCQVPSLESDKWDLLIQASSIGSYGKEPKLWLTGDFQNQMCRSSQLAPLMTRRPPLRFMYPSLKAVRHSHDNLLGGGCLPYSNTVHVKQTWLNAFLHEWSAKHSGRNRAMPHIKSYLRLSPDSSMAAFFLLTSANVSKSAWGVFNKGNGALRINSFEAGVLFVPDFVTKQKFFSVIHGDPDRLPVPYDLPPVPYTSDKTPWVSEYLQ